MRSLTLSRRQPKQLGMTLIEVMISMSLGLIILAGLGYSYLAARNTYREQDALARMQEGARLAFDVLSKDIHMAGFTGCSAALSPANNPTGTATADWYQYFDNNTNTSKLTGTYFLSGYENHQEATIAFNSATNYLSTFPADATYKNNVAGVTGFVSQGDVLLVKHVDPSQQYIVSTGAPANPLVLNVAPNNFTKGQTLIGANCYSGAGGIEIFTDSCNPCTGNQLAYTSTNALATTLANSVVYPLSANAYFICRPSSDPTQTWTTPTGYACTNTTDPALYRVSLSATGTLSTQELVEGVQDMQISYALDTDGDLIPNCYVVASDISKPFTAAFTRNNVTCPAPTVTGGITWNNVLGVRISLLMVSRSTETGITTEEQVYKLDINGDGYINPAGSSLLETVTPTDNLLRKVFTTTVMMKNY